MYKLAQHVTSVCGSILSLFLNLTVKCFAMNLLIRLMLSYIPKEALCIMFFTAIDFTQVINALNKEQ